MGETPGLPTMSRDHSGPKTRQLASVAADANAGVIVRRLAMFARREVWSDPAPVVDFSVKFRRRTSWSIGPLALNPIHREYRSSRVGADPIDPAFAAVTVSLEKDDSPHVGELESVSSPQGSCQTGCCGVSQTWERDQSPL